MYEVKFDATLNHPTGGEVILIAQIPVVQCEEHKMGEPGLPHVHYASGHVEHHYPMVCLPEKVRPDQ